MKNSSRFGLLLAAGLVTSPILKAIAQNNDAAVPGTPIKVEKTEVILNTFPIGDGYSIYTQYAEYTGRSIAEKNGQEYAGNVDITLHCGWDIGPNKQPQLNGYYEFTKAIDGDTDAHQLWRLDNMIVAIETIALKVGRNVDVQVVNTTTSDSTSKECTLTIGAAGEEKFSNYQALAYDQTHQLECSDLWNTPYTLDGVPLKNQATTDGYYSIPARKEYYANLQTQLSILTK